MEENPGRADEIISQVAAHNHKLLLVGPYIPYFQHVKTQKAINSWHLAWQNITGTVLPEMHYERKKLPIDLIRRYIVQIADADDIFISEDCIERLLNVIPPHLHLFRSIVTEMEHDEAEIPKIVLNLLPNWLINFDITEDQAVAMFDSQIRLLK